MNPKNKRSGSPAPEACSWPLALLLTAILWAGATVALILLPPPQSDKGAEPPLYQSISLQLAPLEGGRADGGSSGASEAAGAAPADSGSPQPVNKSVPEPSLPTPARKPAAGTVSTPTSPPALPEPMLSSSDQNLADSEASPSDRRSQPEPAPLDPATLDSDAWESLFAQGDGRSYRSSSQAVAEDQRSSNPESVPSSSLSGVAAATGAGDAGAAVSSRTDGRSQADGPTAETSDAIAGIAQAALSTGEAGGGAKGDRLGRMDSLPSGGTGLELAGGGTRLLLEPAQPVIHISQESRRYIPGSLEVTISLTVSPEGLVLPGSVKITPESLIHPQVQGEIRAQIGKWRFQSAEGSGQVSFKYNIIKK